MKASKLIEEIQKKIKTHGDLDIAFTCWQTGVSRNFEVCAKEDYWDNAKGSEPENNLTDNITVEIT